MMSNTEQEAEREVGVSISTPGDWVVVEHGTLADEQEVDELVGARLGEVCQLTPYRDQLVRSIARTAARAEREGVVFSALLADPGARDAPILANLVVGTSPGPASDLVAEAVPARDGAPANELEAVQQALAGEGAATDGVQEDGVTQRVVHSLLLPGGPTLRVARLMELELVEDGPKVAVLAVEYFFRVAASGQVFVLRFTTPSVAAHEELQLIFHRIAQSFRVDAAD
jgi:hypothetical protein